MLKTTGLREAVQRSVLAGAVLLTAAGCMELQVDNVIAPDRERATANPDDMQAFIGGIFFPTFHNPQGLNHTVGVWPVMSSEMTSSMAADEDFQWSFEVREPRTPHDNTADISAGAGPHGPRNYWAGIGATASIAYDGLQAINEGLVIRESGVDVTDQARAFAKLMQGWAWGVGGLIWDRFHVLPETTPIPADPQALHELVLSTLVPYEDVMAAAVASIEEAIAIAQGNPAVVRYPTLAETPLWFGTATPVTNAQFIGMANTLAARFLVLSARTPEERAQVDWARVLQFTANGLTEDLEVVRAPGRTSLYLLRAQENAASGTKNMRWDYRTIGPADQSGAYQAWIATPVADRYRFDIVTPDRRITGPTPTSDGSYTRYRADDNGFLIERGSYFFSAYQWSRHAIRHGLTGTGTTGTGSNSGLQPVITVDENNLLRAEALLYTGDRAGAAALINITRTRPQTIGGVEYPGLPPVTAAGVPEVGGVCVPRMEFTGACGDLLTALRYERMIELAGVMEIHRGYMDSRGFGILTDGSLLHWPVPGNVLELYRLEYYTYGGVGNPNTAVYAPATMP